MTADPSFTRPFNPRRLATVVALACAFVTFGAADARAADWSGFVDVSGEGVGGIDSKNPAVAISPKGEAVALWSSYPTVDTDVSVVDASARSLSGNWGAPVVLTPTDGYCADWDQSNAQIRVAMDRKGTATAAWICSGTPESTVQVVTRPAGGSWGTPQTIAGPTGMFAISSSTRGQIGLAVTPSGEAIVTYAGFDSSSSEWQVRYQRRAAGSSSFGSPATLYSGTETAGGLAGIKNVRAAAGADGTIAIGIEANGFDSPTTIQDFIVASVKPAGSNAFTAPVEVTAPNETFDVDTDGYQFVAVDHKGRAVLAWVYGENGPDAAQVIIRSRGASGTFGSIQTLTDPTLDMTPGPLAAGPQGTVVYAFLRNLDDDSAAQATLQPNATTFDAVTELSDGLTDVDEPSAAVGLKGLSTVGWSDDDDPGNENDEIEERTRLAGASDFGDIFTLSSGTEADSEDVDFAISPCTGATVAAWESSNGADSPFWTEADYRPGVKFATGSSAWCPGGKPPLKKKGVAGPTSLRVQIGCKPGTTGTCRIRLSGKLRGGSGKLQGKTVKVKAGKRKTVTLAYTPELASEIASRTGNKVRVTSKQVGGGSNSILVRIPDSVTG
ncbi:MAG: hypothetical protein ACKOBH_07210 [bacterium]